MEFFLTNNINILYRYMFLLKNSRILVVVFIIITGFFFVKKCLSNNKVIKKYPPYNKGFNLSEVPLSTKGNSGKSSANIPLT